MVILITSQQYVFGTNEIVEFLTRNSKSEIRFIIRFFTIEDSILITLIFFECFDFRKAKALNKLYYFSKIKIQYMYICFPQ